MPRKDEFETLATPTTRRVVSNVTKLPANSAKPLLLVDVDGVISIFGFPSIERPDGRFLTVDGIPHFLSAAAGGHLLDLAQTFELVWCTGWEEKANEYLPRELGLGADLPVIELSGHAEIGGHWKLPAIDAYTGPRRPVAWIDDAHTDVTRTWARAREGPTLLVATEPSVGIAEEHVAQLTGWATLLDR
jgi:hypothetical protein